MLAQSQWSAGAQMACPAECLKEGPYCAVSMRTLTYYVQALWHSGGDPEYGASRQCAAAALAAGASEVGTH